MAQPLQHKPSDTVSLPSGDTYRISDVIWGGPATFANIAWVVHTSQWLRISFAEQGSPDERPHFRTAIAMPPLEAIAFADALTDVLKPYREFYADYLKTVDDKDG